ncbi:MAG: hypothetical protein KDC23_06095 [Actinobacteria bacterium]|nr:hypothetical protein [Actinomycetota bacterium]
MSPPNPRSHPAWFGAVMGTGALALSLAYQAEIWQWEWLTTAALVTLGLASLLGIVLLPRYLNRLRDRAELAAELRDPGHGAQLATLPAGLLVLAVAWGRLGPEIVPTAVSLWIDGVLLVVGAGLSLALGLAWSSSIIRTQPGLGGINGGWLIPPVMNLLVPLALLPIIAANPAQSTLLIVVAFVFYGLGLTLFLLVMPLVVARLALHEPIPAAMAPSLWIPLAPAGILGFALLRLLQTAAASDFPGITSATPGVVISAMGVGFGLWWGALATLEILRMRRIGRVPRHPGWWGFVFPVAAMTLSVSGIGATTDVWLVKILGLLATVGVLAIWLYAAVVTTLIELRARSAR